MTSHEKYKEKFWDAFHRPDLKSEKFEKVYEQLEPLNDLLAGPMFSIYENANCDYIFTDKERFPLVNQPDDFFKWSLQIINEYKDIISPVDTSSDDEIKDKELLLYQADIMMELADLGFEIILKK